MAESFDSRNNHDAQILTEGFMVYMSDSMGKLMKIMEITQSDNNKWFDVYATMLQGMQATVISLVEEMVEADLETARRERVLHDSGLSLSLAGVGNE